jgi:hypothetical protein
MTKGFRLMRSDEKWLRRAGPIVAIGVLLTGCAAGGYNAGSVRRHLVDAGVSPKAADCVVLHLGPLIGDERLSTHDKANSAEIAAVRKLLQTCDVKVSAR